MSADDPTRSDRADAVTAATISGGSSGDAVLIDERVGEYLLTEVIASGGFGTVYRAEHTTLRRFAAIKLLHPEVAASEAMVRRFEQEARAVNQIRHPHVVDIYDIGMFGDRPFLVMELLEGTDLQARLDRDGRMSMSRALEVLRPLADALDAAHAAGIVHRDIKASNVFLTTSGRVVLLDFGIAKLLHSVDNKLTSSHHILGTPTSMAPEQITGDPVDARTDVYALSALAYHLLTGQLMFEDDSQLVVQHMHLYSDPTPPSRLAPLAASVDTVLLCGLNKDRETRHSSAGDLVEALSAAASDDGEETAERANGVAIHVALEVAEDVLADPDEALLEDLDSVIDQANRTLEGLGFVVGLETGSSLLMVRADGALEARRDAIRAALSLKESLDGRHSRDTRVHVSVIVHAAPVQMAGRRVMGGELVDVSRWSIKGSSAKVIASSSAVAGLKKPGAEVAPGFHEIDG